MRLEGRLRGGYFPAANEPLEQLRERLVWTQQPTAVLDPCIGEGEALKVLVEHSQTSDNLGQPRTTYGVELDPARGAAAQLRLPDARILSPATFFQTNIASESFGLVYCNPPFDDYMGKGRYETVFLQAIPRLLVTGGVLVMVVPEATSEETDFRECWNSNFHRIAVGEFPEEHRPYNEVFIVGVKREEPKPIPESYGWPSRGCPWEVMDLWHPRLKYPVPPSDGPGARFKKSGYTDEELIAALADSPLNRLMAPKPLPPMPAPPLALGNGHLALLLAAGFLDGVVNCPESPHVVRGVAKKEWHHKETREEEGEKNTKIITVQEERMVITVRAAYQNGTIVDYVDNTQGVVE